MKGLKNIKEYYNDEGETFETILEHLIFSYLEDDNV